jgi:hypothetical protein
MNKWSGLDLGGDIQSFLFPRSNPSVAALAFLAILLVLYLAYRWHKAALAAVHERYRTGEALRRADLVQTSDARIRAVLNTVVDGIITIDSLGMIESANPAATRVFGYTPAEMVGQNVSLLMPEPYRSAHDTFMNNYLSSGVKKIIGIGCEVVGNFPGLQLPLFVDALQAPFQKINLQGLLPNFPLQFGHPAFFPPPLTRAWKRVPRTLPKFLPPAMQQVRINLKHPRHLPNRRPPLQSLRRQLGLSAKLPPRQTHDAFLHSLNSAS